MMGLTYEDIVNRIKEEKGLSEEEISLKVKERLNKLSGLVSKEGAAHIVANELGIDILEIIKRRGIKINRLMPGMRGIGVLAKVLKSYGARDFNKNGRSGKVMSFLLGDDTGLIRLVLWDVNHIQLLQDNNIKDGDILRVYDGMVKDNNGYREVHLGSNGKITLNPEGEVVNVKQNEPMEGQLTTIRKRKINELMEGDNFVAITGVIVQLFEPRFYDACEECGKKVYGKCSDHKTAGVKSVPIINLFFDDGSDNIRVVLFRDQALEILGVNDEKLAEIKTNLSIFDDIKKQLNGKELTLIGKVVKNDMFERKEFIVQKMMNVNPSQLAGELLKV